MAINTRNRRFSLIGFGTPVPTVAPTPDGGIDTVGERAQWLWLYAGLSLGATITLPSVNRTVANHLTARRVAHHLTPRRFTLKVP